MLDLPMTREESWRLYKYLQDTYLEQGPEQLAGNRASTRTLRSLLSHGPLAAAARCQPRLAVRSRAAKLQADPDGYLDLWAREHYKSTLITFGLTMQEILTNPDSTIGIFSPHTTHRQRLPVRHQARNAKTISI